MYNNPLMDTTRFNTPASFSFSQDGNPIVNASSNSDMQIIAPASTTISSLGGDDLGGLDLLLETEIKSYVDK
jgi:hypothetical protein